MKKNYLGIIQAIGEWMHKVLVQTQAQGFVYGVSGGIDSALVCALMMRFFPKQSLALWMDLESSMQDQADANLVISHFQAHSCHINLTPTYQQMLQVCPQSKQAAMNLKARLRMNCLYYYAQAHNYLVCGTSNGAEWYTGYFTKYGDSACDLLPIVNFTKHDVYQCALLLKVPQNICQKPPSAGLLPNQTDEADMGITYAEIDAFLEAKQLKTKTQQHLSYLHTRSEHKRNPPLSFLPLGSIIKKKD